MKRLDRYFYAVLLAVSSAAWGEGARAPEFRQGECVIFREGGIGHVLKTPTYWVQGRVAGIEPVRRWAGRCPVIGRPISAYSREDWVRIVDALPCVEADADVREVKVLRIQMQVERWETPWSRQHGNVGWLFRGLFVNTPLKQGEIIDMDASWLERCDAKAED